MVLRVLCGHLTRFYAIIRCVYFVCFSDSRCGRSPVFVVLFPFRPTTRNLLRIIISVECAFLANNTRVCGTHCARIGIVPNNNSLAARSDLYIYKHVEYVCGYSHHRHIISSRIQILCVLSSSSSFQCHHILVINMIICVIILHTSYNDASERARASTKQTDFHVTLKHVAR